MMTDATPAEFRRNFPMLDDSVHLASCSQGARSTYLDTSIEQMMSSITDNGAPWDLWMGEVELARRQFAEFIHASADEIALVPNASIGAFQAGSTLDYSDRAGIVSTDMEFPSIGHVWMAQRHRGAKVAFVPEHDGYVEASDYETLIDGTTNLVSIPVASYKNGARLPVNVVSDIAHKSGARVFVDAYQAAGVVPIDVRTLDCDYLVTGTLKYMLGLPGLAFLYVRDGVNDQTDPELTGWFGRVNPFEFDPQHLDFPSQARRLETGTPGIPSVYAANAGLRLLQQTDPATVWTHVSSLVQQTSDRLRETGYELYSPSDPQRSGPQVAVRTSDSDGLGAALKQRRIFSSPRGDAVRLAFHYFNTQGDVDACVEAFADLKR